MLCCKYTKTDKDIWGRRANLAIVDDDDDDLDVDPREN
jgi:hypothetical protein